MAKGKSNPNPRGRKNGNGGTDKETASRREPRADERSAAGGNANDRKKIRQQCAKAMRAIQAQRQDLNEEAGDIRERLKNAGINVAAFMAALRVVDMDDSAARDDYVTNLQEAFNDLAPGQQLDFVSAFEKEEEAPEGEGESKDEFETDDVRPRHLREAEAQGTA